MSTSTSPGNGAAAGAAPAGRRPVVVVVGAGIAGLSAALTLAEDGAGSPGPAPEVIVLEAGERLGGKIRTEELDGWLLEAGPDAFLTRVPDGVELCRRLGLGDELVAPAPGGAAVWSGGRLRPLPAGLVMGVPTRLGPLARSGILSPLGLARASLDLVLPSRAAPPDRSVAHLVSARLGHQVHDRLVEPLVGGINAGPTGQLSAALTAPQLDAAARRSRSLILGLRGSGPSPGGPRPAPFLTPRRGLGDLVDRLAARLRSQDQRVRVHTGRPVESLGRVQSLGRAGGSWVLGTPSGPVTADGVVLALPAFSAAGLVRPHAREAGRRLATIEYASVSLVAMAYPAATVPGPLDGTGYLVPAREGRLTTACTWTSSKWPHLARPGRVLFRVSTGRWGDDRHAAMDDQALVEAAHRELAAALGLTAARPQAWRVLRWPRSFPQYRVGHAGLVAQVESDLEGLPALALAGAAYRGIGIPACIAQGRRAALSVLAALSSTGRPGGR